MIHLEHPLLSSETLLGKHKESASEYAKRSSGRWTKEEHQRFIDGIRKFGKNWKQVEDYIGTRTGAQIRSHAQKFFNRLEREYNASSDKCKKENSKSATSMIRKESDCSLSTNTSVQGDSCQEENQNEDIPLNLKAPKELLRTLSDNASVHSESPKAEPNELSEQKVQRKLSLDLPSTTGMPSTSLFDFIMARFNLSSIPKLSDLVEMQGPKDQNYNRNSFLLASFKPNPRKLSDDNCLFKEKLIVISQPSYSELEVVAKKLRTSSEILEN
jgi:SHAQKYF class myb-like DNA-binding protein